MEESVSQMTTMLSNILEHHGRANQHLASLEEDLLHSKREEEKLKAMIEALEKEKREMNAKVALMEKSEKKDIYELLEAKMEGFQIANHPRTIGGFEIIVELEDPMLLPRMEVADDDTLDAYFNVSSEVLPTEAIRYYSIMDEIDTRKARALGVSEEKLTNLTSRFGVEPFPQVALNVPDVTMTTRKMRILKEIYNMPIERVTLKIYLDHKSELNLHSLD
ncbi:hypothetical protein R1flu_006594 [Riccia fluitans]|uniref:Uncharacterized protein n=1 Tax=Riccia fluitans TaxID=41844 RepID=A0ABD1YWT6_9MARC